MRVSEPGPARPKSLRHPLYPPPTGAALSSQTRYLALLSAKGPGLTQGQQPTSVPAMLILHGGPGVLRPTGRQGTARYQTGAFFRISKPNSTAVPAAPVSACGV